jgi:hypothetical protein
MLQMNITANANITPFCDEQCCYNLLYPSSVPFYKKCSFWRAYVMVFFRPRTSKNASQNTAVRELSPLPITVEILAEKSEKPRASLPVNFNYFLSTSARCGHPQNFQCYSLTQLAASWKFGSGL